MGTIVDKFNYSFEAKDLIKDSINNLGGSITSETELKEYAQELDNIYDNLPKTTGEDTNLSLTTLKGKMNTTLKGDTQQGKLPSTYQQVEYIESTGQAYIDTGIIPNTNTKIDISFELITKGNYGIIFGGEDAYNSNGFHLYNTSGNFDISFGARYSASMIPFELNTKYKFIMDKTGFTLNGTPSVPFETNTISTTYSIYLFAVHRATNVTETNAQKRIYYCKLYNNGTLVRDMIPCYRVSDNVIGMYDVVGKQFYTNAGSGSFTKGSNAPTPDTPIDIEVVTGTQEVKVENVNLCKNAIVNATSSAYVDILHVDMDLKPNTTYTISFKGTSGNKIYLNENITTSQYFTCTGNRESRTFTTTSTLDKTNHEADGWIIFKNQSANVETPNFVDVQIELGSTATDFVEHQEQTQIVSLGDIELCKIGNYQDYLYKSNDKWYKKEYIGKHTFTNSDNWVTQPYGTNSWVLNYKVNLLVNDSITIIKSNIFTGIDKNSRSTSTNNIIYANDSVGIFIRNTELTTQAQVQTATTGNYIYYIASTPNDIEITNETLIEQLDNLEKLKSYNGVTNINCSGNLSAILGVSAIKGES